MTAPERDGAAHDLQRAEDVKIIARIDDHGENLTDWEIGFIERCFAILDENRVLPPTMREKVEEIERERVD